MCASVRVCVIRDAFSGSDARPSELIGSKVVRVLFLPADDVYNAVQYQLQSLRQGFLI